MEGKENGPRSSPNVSPASPKSERLAPSVRRSSRPLARLDSGYPRTQHPTVARGTFQSATSPTLSPSLRLMLSTYSQLEKEGEGAAITSRSRRGRKKVTDLPTDARTFPTTSDHPARVGVVTAPVDRVVTDYESESEESQLSDPSQKRDRMTMTHTTVNNRSLKRQSFESLQFHLFERFLGAQ